MILFNYGFIRQGYKIQEERSPGMEEYKAALEFLKTLLTEQRLLKRKISHLEEDIEVWTSRISLAEREGEIELMSAARKMQSELEKEKTELEVESDLMEREIQRAKEDLSRLEKTRNIRLDPGKLLEKIEKLTGEKTEDYYLEAELEKLKKEMEN